MERGGIDLVGAVDVADVGCLEVQAAQDEGLCPVLVNIGDADVVDFQRVYLERVDVLQRLRPAAHRERNAPGRLAAQLQEVDVDFRPVQHQFAYEPPRKEPAPVDVGLDHGEIGDRKIRMGLLQDGKSFQGRGEADQLDMYRLKPDRIPFQVTVQFLFRVAAQRFVKEIRCAIEDKGQDDRHTDNPANYSGSQKFFSQGPFF